MANPTTNYGWPMPTATDLVTDLPADFAAFGQPVDTSLKALNPETTLGDIAYRSATANTNTRLAIGSSGNVLTVAGGVPTWAAPAGGGKVLQVVSASTATPVSISTTTMTDSGITATITPTLATSKILVIFSASCRAYRGANNANTNAQVLRGATQIIDMDNEGFIGGQFSNATTVDMIGQYTNHVLDAPATTSATTYKLQGSFNTTLNSPLLVFQYQSTTSSITLMEIGA